MKKMLRIVAAFCGLVAALFVAVLWVELRSVLGPKHEGKYLANLLAEIRNANPMGMVNPRQPEVLAVQAIGTNALPWLLSELGTEGSNLQQTINNFLNRRKIGWFRFPDINDRLSRAVLGFRILGPTAAPAIPQVLALVDRKPGYAPLALAAIGPAAIPELRQCLTTTNMIATSRGPMNLVPGNTIAGLQGSFNPNSEIGRPNLPQSFGGKGFRRNSTYCSNMPRFSSSLFRSKSCDVSGLRISEFGFNVGRFTKPELGALLLDLQKLATGTNSHAAIYAQQFLAVLEKSGE